MKVFKKWGDVSSIQEPVWNVSHWQTFVNMSGAHMDVHFISFASGLCVWNFFK